MVPSDQRLHVRPFCLADAPAVEPWLTGPGLSLPPGPARSDWPSRMLAQPQILAWVGVRGREPIAFARLDVGPDRIAELTLVVAPAWRRRGYGAQLLQAVLEGARRGSIRRLHALVHQDNEAALQFFLARGFEQDGAAPGGQLRCVRLVHAGGGQHPLEIDV